MASTNSKNFRFTDGDLKLLEQLAAEMNASQVQTIRRAFVGLRKMLDDGYRFTQTGDEATQDTIVHSPNRGQTLVFYVADEDGRLVESSEAWFRALGE